MTKRFWLKHMSFVMFSLWANTDDYETGIYISVVNETLRRRHFLDPQTNAYSNSPGSLGENKGPWSLIEKSSV